MNTLVTLLVRKRRLFELLAARGMLANQQVTFLTDGADDVRDLPLYLNPQAEHLLDWFHVTMRLTVLTHEIYSALAYDDDCPSVLDVEGMAERTVLLDGWSKTYAMTGWRLGYGVFPPALVEPVTRLVVNSVSCVPAFSQYAAIVALESPPEPVAQMKAAFRTRRQVVVDGLNAIDGISCQLPGGAFYAFPNITGLGRPAAAVAGGLLRDAGVACVAGTAFGAAGEGYLRLSYASSVPRLQEALAGIDAFVRATAG